MSFDPTVYRKGAQKSEIPLLRAISLEAQAFEAAQFRARGTGKGAAQGEKKVKKINHVLVAAAAVCTLFAAGAKAQCGSWTAGKQKITRPRLPGQALQSAAPETSGSTSTSIAGLWLVTFVSEGQVVDEGFDLWNNDGTEILNDTPPPSTGNVCLGVWVKSGITFKLKHPSWTFDDAGNLNGTAIIREQVTLSPTGNSFIGPATLDVYDLNGNLLYHVDAQVTGQRIVVD